MLILRRGLLTLLVTIALLVPALAQTRIFTDDAGRMVEIPGRVERVMAAGPPAAVLLYSLAPDKMAGWVTAPSEEARAFLAEPYRDLPAHGRLTGRGGTANVEAALAMRPDIILDVGTVDETYASLADRVQEQTGIPYVLIEGRFEGTVETIEKAGDLLGQEERAEQLAAYGREALARLDALLAQVPQDERPRVYYGRGPEGLETGVANSINTEVLEAVGAVNVARSAGSGGLAGVSVEQVLAWDPDVILTLDPAFHASLAANPLWAGIAAVENGRVFRAPALPFGWFDAPPGINRLIGVSWLASVLYPDRFEDDLRGETAEFYRLFYRVDLTEEQLDTLLADAQ
ncbi:iron ABC transporter substrate-binding protein [Aureimonas populi]|uniref:Iron ABC transporter substrate-binding protein n=1 Tax=Aureimonas populi TaxID=1701758 RepID=A0ABW5CJV4_9HYPH|nr:iron ABC transporter substrate-binding protein [Aureimonas populi]